jgi:hypothetical protein
MMFHANFDPRRDSSRLSPAALGFEPAPTAISCAPAEPADPPSGRPSPHAERVRRARARRWARRRRRLLGWCLSAARWTGRLAVEAAVWLLRRTLRFLRTVWGNFKLVPALAIATTLAVAFAAFAAGKPSPWASAVRMAPWTLVLATTVALYLHSWRLITRLAPKPRPLADRK